VRIARFKVFYLITELNVGGAERALAQLLAGLDRDRFEPVVACLYGSSSPVAASIRARGIPVLDLGMAHKWQLGSFWRLYRSLQEERPDILHTWLFHANVTGRVLGRLAGVPVVVCGERTMGMESHWRYLVNRLTLFLADRVVCVSEQVAAFCARRIGLSPDKAVVIPNGVEFPGPSAQLTKQAAREALGLSTDKTLIGTVARLDPVKRLDVLLTALALLDDAHAIIVGYGSEEQRLKAMAEDLGLEARVQFVGYQQDVWPWLAACDVFALSSDWEGMPNAVLEAMGMGVPVVATAAGGTQDVVADGRTGLLVPRGDSAALAAALERLIGDSTLRRTMGAEGRRRARACFSAEQMVQRTLALYAELLDR
jgi:glycosyltransferase involved in cell wall biosynthesis